MHLSLFGNQVTKTDSRGGLIRNLGSAMQLVSYIDASGLKC